MRGESPVERLMESLDKSALPKKIKEHSQAFLDELMTIPLNQKRFREMVYKGAPDTVLGFRPLAWKILLNYLV
jgi:uncharacterized protein YqkB